MSQRTETHLRRTRLRRTLVVLALVATGWAPGHAAEIVSTQVDGDQLMIEVDLSSAPGAKPWQLVLLGGNGELVDSTQVSAPAGGALATTTLSLSVPTLTQRGWQHSLELVASDGTLADQLDLHLGLDCQADMSSCDLMLRHGLRVAGALYSTPEMGEVLDEVWDTPGAVLELDEVVQRRPELGGITIQILVESGRLAGPNLGCSCAFNVVDPGGGGLAHSVAWFDDIGGPYAFDQELARGPSFLLAGFSTERTIEVELLCSQIADIESLTIPIAGHQVALELPTLAPCESLCDGSVAWSLGDLRWDGILDPAEYSTELSAVSIGYDFTWELDDTYLAGRQDSWLLSGPQATRFLPSGQVSLVPMSLVESVPSSLSVSGHAWVELRDWLPGTEPQGQITAGALLRLEAQAPCADAASFEGRPTVFFPGVDTAVIKLVVGPEDP